MGWTADSEFPADIAFQVDEHGHDGHVVTESPSRIVAGRRGVGVAHMINRDERSKLVKLWRRVVVEFTGGW